MRLLSAFACVLALSCGSAIAQQTPITSCESARTALVNVDAATTKEAVASALKSAGAPPEAADNLAKASPDVQAARENARGILGGVVRRRCGSAA
jgi:hypothetical protein